jgi:hypothetical protein
MERSERLRDHYGVCSTAPTIEIAIVDEVASRVPLPIDQPFTAVARGIQVTGICLCVLQDRDLVRCRCFVDLVKLEGRQQLNRVFKAALGDWISLQRYDFVGAA